MGAVRLSKLLSLVLRHDPARVGITLDPAGWVPVSDLILALNRAGIPCSRSDVEEVVRTSDKQRFVIDPSTDRVRANQGHSVPVALGLPQAVPPPKLYHGTPLRSLDAILREGLVKQSRHAVHLSADLGTAHQVGARRGAHVVLAIAAAEMHQVGYHFSRSTNGVWLVDRVPPEYLSQISEHESEA
jgi:putative RNA 2'-phosphotransferase